MLAVLCAAACGGAAQPQGQAQGQAQPQAGRCGPGRYWSAALRRCVECSHCAGPGREVTLRPCDGVRDAQCGSLRDMDIDWEWLRDRGAGLGAGLGKVKGEYTVRLHVPVRPSLPRETRAIATPRAHSGVPYAYLAGTSRDFTLRPAALRGVRGNSRRN